MKAAVDSPRHIRFESFELDLRTCELRKDGSPVKLQGQPMQILVMLLERPGEIVTREELQKTLWPNDTFVEFDHSINAAIKRLRHALSDSAESPRYIETLARRGYRFIWPIDGPVAVVEQDRAAQPTEVAVTSAPKFKNHRLLLSGAAVLAILAVLAVYWRWWRGGGANDGTSSHKEVTVTPFTTYQGQEVSPAFSPDGSQIVFAWDGGNSDKANRFDLYVKVIGSESLLRLTFKPSAWLVPAWSPDGRTIAFQRIADNDSGIFTVPAIGGPERKLADETLRYSFLQTLNWSPDGKELMYVHPEEQGAFLSNIRILSAETGNVRQMTIPECQDAFSPIVSPDGKWLAFNCSFFSEGVTRIFVMPRGGGSARQIVGVPGEPWPLAWSNDSRRIIFSKPLANDLWEVSRDGGRPSALLFARDALQPAVARQGSRLAYAAGYNVASLWRMDLNGKSKAPPHLLISSTRSQAQPAISPDGKKMAFDSDRSGWGEVWVSDFDGSNLVQLSNFHSLTGTPKWSPDGRTIVFDSRESGHPALYLVEPDRGLPHKIPINLRSASVPTWSRDGRWIYFTSEAASESGLYKVPREGGNAILVSSTQAYNAQEASDGSLYFAAARHDAEIHVIRNPGGKEVSLANMPRVVNPPDWALAPNGIYFVDSKTAPATLSFFDFQTGKVRALTALQKQPDPDIWAGIAITLDQRYLVYTQIDEKVSDIMLAENYR